MVSPGMVNLVASISAISISKLAPEERLALIGGLRGPFAGSV